MDFRGPAASADADCLILLPPFCTARRAVRFHNGTVDQIQTAAARTASCCCRSWTRNSRRGSTPKRERKVRVFAAVIALLLATPALALENENLLVAVPPGYKVGYTKHTPKGVITEMVPSAETVETWTEMVTVQIFFGMHDSVIAYRLRLERLWASACAGARSAPIGGGLVNGYNTMTWRLSCLLNRQTGKPEMTWFKAISGRDSFYVVQKAFKFEPAPDKAKEWVGWLHKVSVCDTRIAERKCPAEMR